MPHETQKIAGNVFDKYQSRNPLVKMLMRGFDDALSDLVARVAPRDIHDVGCGEGIWVTRWRQQGIAARGSDESREIIEVARSNARDAGIAGEIFRQRGIHDLDPAVDGADLVTCCEVLEHVVHPEQALEKLRAVVRGHLILSVPREPIWRALNLARGAYIADLGNTPGHVNHWSSREFVDLVSRYFDVLAVKQPLPWTMLLCKTRESMGSGPGSSLK